ncbi:MAG: hypothetical protein JSW61_00505 [Candidatus Thorarchaeota archaeon]|nr:MAG: hypothetical protein JSW61_00505 [Candidatus Thorarchaeota archaeon]
MGVADEWSMLSERVLHVKGRPGRLALVAVVLVYIAEAVSIIGLWINGRFNPAGIDINWILSMVAAGLFFGVFGWGAVFLKGAYYKTIEQLSFKDEKAKSEFLTKEAVYSDTFAAIGAVLTATALGVALSVWPLFTGYFIPTFTFNLAPYFAIALLILALVASLGIDAVAAISRLVTIPRRLRDHLQISLLRPDRCGGAKAIGDYYFLFTLLVAAIGSLTIVISGTFEDIRVGYFLAATFLLVGVGIFLVPQMSVRSILRAEKLSRLEEISHRVDDLSDPSQDLDSDEMILAFLQVQSLIMLYGEIEKLREFPFETGTFQKVLSTALVPIVLQIIFTILRIT